MDIDTCTYLYIYILKVINTKLKLFLNPITFVIFAPFYLR